MIYAVNKRTKEHLIAEIRPLKNTEWVAIEADENGWIKWSGRECPLPDDQLCEVKLRRDNRSISRHKPACQWIWECWGISSDIIAYRPILDDKPQAPEWNGEGAPSTGCKVSYPSGRGIVRLPPDVYKVVIVEDDEGGYKRVDVRALEPIRTDRERWVDAAIEAHANADYPSNEFEAIYDALKSGELPQP